MRDRINMEALQEKVGLLDNDSGIVTQAIKNSDIESLLAPYLETVDYQLYFNYANRIIIGKYIKDGEPKTSLLKKSIYYALKGNEYNLRTLIETTNLDYDPISNYEVHETIDMNNNLNETMKYGAKGQVTTASISSFGVEIVDEIGEVVLTKTVDFDGKENIETFNHGEITKTTDHESTTNTGTQLNKKVDNIEYSAQKETQNTSETLDDSTENRTLTSQKGERTSNSGEEVKVSAYNATTYKPSSDTSTNMTQDAVTDKDTEVTTVSERTNTGNKTTNIDAHTDTHTVTDTLGPREDSTSGNGSEVTSSHLDTITFKQNPYNDSDTTTTDAHTNKQTRKEEPHEKTSKTDEKAHEDSRERTDTGNRVRDLTGRYGFTTIQSMIEAERNLANLNIAERIIAIIIHQICEGVLYVS